MKKNKLISGKSLLKPFSGIIIISLLFASCAKNELDDLQPAPFSKNNGATELNGVENIIPEIQIEPVIYISHGNCYGTCPAYSVKAFADGSIEFTGVRYVNTFGTVRYQVNPTLINRLAYMMYENGFLKFEDHYPIVVDGQQTITSLRWKGQYKVVSDYGRGIPDVLIRMRMDVENALGIDRFIGIVPEATSNK